MRRMLEPAGRVGELTAAAYLCLQRSGIPAGVPIVVRRAGFPQQPQSSKKGDSRHGTDMPVKSLIVANGRQPWHHLFGWTAKQHIGCGIRQTHNQCPNVWRSISAVIKKIGRVHSVPRPPNHSMDEKRQCGVRQNAKQRLHQQAREQCAGHDLAGGLDAHPAELIRYFCTQAVKVQKISKLPATYASTPKTSPCGV